MVSIAPPFCSSHEPTDELLLLAALHGDHLAWKALVKRLNRYLAATVRRRGPELPKDLRQDVIQEIWTEVATRADADFNPSVRPARHYIAGFVGLALDRVRATYRPPGERSRRRDAARDAVRQPSACRVVSLDELNESEQPQDPRCETERDKVEASIDIRRAHQLASPPVAHAIDIMWRGDSLSEAAMVVGINRLTLRRQLLQLGLCLAAA